MDWNTICGEKEIETGEYLGHNPDTEIISAVNELWYELECGLMHRMDSELNDEIRDRLNEQLFMSFKPFTNL